MMNLIPELAPREIARIDDFVLSKTPFVATDFLQYTIRDYEERNPYSLFRGAEVLILKHAQSLLFMIQNKKMNPSDAVAKLAKIEAELAETDPES